MQTCEYSVVCGHDALDGHDGKCMLHSEESEKDVEAFEEALEEHREEHGADFRRVVFPTQVHFTDATFEDEADFLIATFEEGAYLEGSHLQNASFKKAARFNQSFERDDDFNSS